ncbi:MAG TPA: GNAT family N-acetyltransferase [Candidatus Stackebrandtia excrementipullorum]|nr:GNAT family N-acetyltransferase [Candidatus Stackebrandtia excrementipullorum]
MRLIALDPADDTAVDAFVDFASVVENHDRDVFRNCPVFLRRRLTTVDSEVDLTVFAAVDADRVVGALMLQLPKNENTHIAQAGVAVHPLFRRRGIGTRLMDKAVELAREHGRGTLVTDAVHPCGETTGITDTGRPFAKVHGFEPALTMTGLRVDLDAARAREDALWDSVRRACADYELISYTCPTPEELVGGVAALSSRVNSDIPHGDLEVDESTYDVRRVRESEVKESGWGVTKLVTIARHRGTGRFGGYSTGRIFASATDVASVGITLVDPEHRGHRLGLALKIQLHRDLRRSHPTIRVVETGNANENEHMLRLNEQLGFAPVGCMTAFQKSVG